MRRPGWLGVGLLYAALAVGGWPGAGLAAGGLVVLGAAVYSSDAGFPLLGPLARWELVRTGRRRALFVWRAAAVLAVGVVVSRVFLTNRLAADGSHAVYARAAEEAVTTVGLGVLGLSVLFCLFNLSGVIAEERAAGRLEHLLVTDLRDHEILLGKLAARLAVLGVYAAAGLPVLAVVTVYGGVPPGAVLVGGVGLLGGLAVLAAVCLFASACAYRPAGGVAFAFGLCVLLGGGLLGLSAVVHQSKPTPSRMVMSSGERAVVDFVGPILTVPVPGNPVRFIDQLQETAFAGEWDTRGGELLRGYLACVLVLVAGFGWAAGWHLRRVGMKPPADTKAAYSPVRAPVGDEPIVWYARHVLPGWPGWWVGRVFRGRWWAAGGAVGLLLALGLAIDGPRETVAENLRLLIPLAGPSLFLTVTVPTGFVAARALAGERDKDTLEALLLTGLEPGEIVRQKWWGVVLSVQGRCAAAAAACLCGLLAGGSPLGCAAVALTTAANVALVTSLGLWCSTMARTANRACLGYTLLVGGWVGFWLLMFSVGWSDPLVKAVPAMFLCPLVQLPAGLIAADDSESSESLLLGCCMMIAVPLTIAASSGFYRTVEGEFVLDVKPIREAAHP